MRGIRLHGFVVFSVCIYFVRIEEKRKRWNEKKKKKDLTVDYSCTFPFMQNSQLVSRHSSVRGKEKKKKKGHQTVI